MTPLSPGTDGFDREDAMSGNRAEREREREFWSFLSCAEESFSLSPSTNSEAAGTKPYK